MSYEFCSKFHTLSGSAKILKTKQKFWKPVKIWQSYRKFKGGNSFETQCITCRQWPKLWWLSVFKIVRHCARTHDSPIQMTGCQSVRTGEVSHYAEAIRPFFVVSAKWIIPLKRWRNSWGKLCWLRSSKMLQLGMSYVRTHRDGPLPLLAAETTVCWLALLHALKTVFTARRKASFASPVYMLRAACPHNNNACKCNNGPPAWSGLAFLAAHHLYNYICYCNVPTCLIIKMEIKCDDDAHDDVCPSHSGIVSKRGNAEGRGLHRRVARCLQFSDTKSKHGWWGRPCPCKIWVQRGRPPVKQPSCTHFVV